MMRKNRDNPEKSLRGAFSLVELLVSISIILLLASILIPSLGKAVDYGKLSKCTGNLRVIGSALNLYQIDHNGSGQVMVNGARWYALPQAGGPAGAGGVSTETLIASADPAAYWGVAYVKWGAIREAYNCPSATAVFQGPASDPGYVDGSFDAGHTYTTYGFNGVRVGYTGKWTPMFMTGTEGSKATPSSLITSPTDTIVAQDAMEQMLDGGGDIPPDGLASYTLPNERIQYFRHRGGNAILWADLHVEAFYPPNKKPTDWQIRWYVRGRDALGMME